MKIDRNITYYGTLLSCGNKEEFPLIRNELKKRGVNYNELEKNGGILFFFQKEEFSKLPVDKTIRSSKKIKQYLPVDDDSGHSIYSVNNLFDIMN